MTLDMIVNAELWISGSNCTTELVYKAKDQYIPF